MDNFLLDKTKSTPEINFNTTTGLCKISGSSYPENAREFFQPIFDWVNSYITTVTKDLTFEINLDYLNSSSIKFISDLIDKLDKYTKIGPKVIVNWRYKEDDEDIKELGEDFKSDVSMEFNIIEN